MIASALLLCSLSAAPLAWPDEPPLPPAFPHLRYGFELGGGYGPLSGLFYAGGRVGGSLTAKLGIFFQPALVLSPGAHALSGTVELEFNVDRYLQLAVGPGIDLALSPFAVRFAPELQLRLLPKGATNWDDPTRESRWSLAVTLAGRALVSPGAPAVGQVRLAVGIEYY